LVAGIVSDNQLTILQIKKISKNEYEEVKTGEVLLKVENLSQHFGPLKAVNNVSFEVKKGEIFGLVGESGCGKTTTGRSIIKIYDVTGGDVYFKGQRICAGTRSYTDAIKVARRDAKSRIAELNADTKANPTNADENKNKINEIKEGLKAVVLENKKQIASAKNDQKNVDKEYAAKLCEKVKAEYAEKFNRKIFAIPGRVDNPNVLGCHKLIQEGAALVNDFNDIARNFSISSSEVKMPETVQQTFDFESDDEKAVWQQITFDGTSFDQLMMSLNIPVGRVTAALISLEMRRLIENCGANTYRKKR
jgi:energy-coupling factor transporter ATP-binding protein EcfA2